MAPSRHGLDAGSFRKSLLAIDVPLRNAVPAGPCPSGNVLSMATRAFRRLAIASPLKVATRSQHESASGNRIAAPMNLPAATPASQTFWNNSSDDSTCIIASLVALSAAYI